MNSPRASSPASEVLESQHDSDDIPEHGDNEPDPIPTISRIEYVRTSQAFVQCLKEARLKNSGLEEEDIERLRNPTAIPPDQLDDRYLQLSINVFLVCTNASEETYKSVHAAILCYDPDSKMLSYDQVKRRIKQITGVIPLYHNMCVNTCLAFMGPFKMSMHVQCVKNLAMKPDNARTTLKMMTTTTTMMTTQRKTRFLDGSLLYGPAISATLTIGLPQGSGV